MEQKETKKQSNGTTVVAGVVGTVAGAAAGVAMANAANPAESTSNVAEVVPKAEKPVSIEASEETAEESSNTTVIVNEEHITQNTIVINGEGNVVTIDSSGNDYQDAIEGEMFPEDTTTSEFVAETEVVENGGINATQTTVVIEGDGNAIAIDSSENAVDLGEGATAADVYDAHQTTVIIEGEDNAVSIDASENIISQEFESTVMTDELVDPNASNVAGGAVVEPYTENGGDTVVVETYEPTVQYGIIETDLESGLSIVDVNVGEETISLVDVNADGVADSMILPIESGAEIVDISGENIPMEPTMPEDVCAGDIADYVNNANVDNFMM